jgi:hypothetical protein
MAGGEGFWRCVIGFSVMLANAGGKERTKEAHRQKHRLRPASI